MTEKQHEEPGKHKVKLLDGLSRQVIGCAIGVYKTWGPGLAEATYAHCLAHELSMTGLSFVRQNSLPVNYKRVAMECRYRPDFLIENKLIVEVKAVDQLQIIHEAQILNYLRLSHLKVGLLINFNEVLLRNGIKRLVL